LQHLIDRDAPASILRISSHAVSVQELPLTALPSAWPLLDDVILIGSSGFARSGRWGLTLNVTSDLLSAACGSSPSSGCRPSLADALSDPSVVLTAATSAWGFYTMPHATAFANPFALTLAGTSWVILRAQRARVLPAFSNATSVWLGRAPCNVAAVSVDGRWALLRTPSPIAICGSNTTACGYVALEVVNPAAAAGDAELPPYNITVSCPPLCPGSYDASVAAPFAPSVAGVIALGSIPPPVSGGAPVLLRDPDTASIGIYYTLLCSATGVFTDPTTSNACVNASDPASVDCAYGTGDACVRCPGGALCPGGYRLWSRPGWWVASEASGAVLSCPPPSSVRCVGWDAGSGVTACGLGYLAGSYLCGACAHGFFDPGDGTCAGCPVVSSAWEKYRGLLGLVAGLLVVVSVMAAALFIVVKLAGGTFFGLARRVLTLGVWALLTVQTLASLPAALRIVYNVVSVLTLEVRCVAQAVFLLQLLLSIPPRGSPCFAEHRLTPGLHWCLCFLLGGWRDVCCSGNVAACSSRLPSHVTYRLASLAPVGSSCRPWRCHCGSHSVSCCIHRCYLAALLPADIAKCASSGNLRWWLRRDSLDR
jgi:hypothetical protein